MKFIWILVAVVTINVTEAKSIIDIDLEKGVIESDVSKPSNPSSYVMARRRSISLFPNMTHRGKNFMINLNPTMKTVRQTELEKYRRPFMKKLLIKDTNNKDKVRVTAEVTTRRSLLQRKTFSVRPQDVYARKIHKKYNWKSSTTTYNLEKSKSETNMTKAKFQSRSDEQGTEEETHNFNSDDFSVNDHDYVHLEKEHISNITDTHDNIGLGESETLLLFPIRNISNYLNINALQRVYENVTASNVNDQKTNVKIIEDQQNTTIFPKVNIKSDSRDQIDKLKENIFDKEEKDQEEYIYVKEINQKAVSNAKRDVSSIGAMTNRERFRFYSFMKNKTS